MADTIENIVRRFQTFEEDWTVEKRLEFATAGFVRRTDAPYFDSVQCLLCNVLLASFDGEMGPSQAHMW